MANTPDNAARPADAVDEAGLESFPASDAPTHGQIATLPVVDQAAQDLVDAYRRRVWRSRALVLGALALGAALGWRHRRR